MDTVENPIDGAQRSPVRRYQSKNRIKRQYGINKRVKQRYELLNQKALDLLGAKNHRITLGSKKRTKTEEL